MTNQFHLRWNYPEKWKWIFLNIWFQNCLEKDPSFRFCSWQLLIPLLSSSKYEKMKIKSQLTYKFIFYKKTGDEIQKSEMHRWLGSKIGNAYSLRIFVLYKSAPNKFWNTLQFQEFLNLVFKTRQMWYHHQINTLSM